MKKSCHFTAASERLRMKRVPISYAYTFSLLLKAIPIYIHNKTLIAACDTHFHMPNINLFWSSPLHQHIIHSNLFCDVEHFIKKNLILDRKTITTKWTFKSSHHPKFLHCQHSFKKKIHSCPVYFSFNLIRGFNVRCLFIFGVRVFPTLFTGMSYRTMNINVRNKIEPGSVHMRAQIIIF